MLPALHRSVTGISGFFLTVSRRRLIGSSAVRASPCPTEQTTHMSWYGRASTPGGILISFILSFSLGEEASGASLAM